MSSADSQPLPWQQPLWQKLTELHRHQRLPHALLFSGAAGTGKRQLAEVLAAYLLCQTPDDHACGRCKGCLLLAQNSHPDLQRISPEDTGKAILIGQIRELNDFLNAAPQQGGYRVSIIHPAEEMNLNAANALLKGLEEPGDRSLFILISEMPGRMLPTIRSRCQRYPVALPGESDALRWLDREVQDPETSRVLLGLAGGAPLAALELHRQEGLALRRRWLRSLAQVASGKQSAIELAAVWMKEEPISLLDWWLGVMSDLLRHQQVGPGAPLRNLDARALVPKLTARACATRLFDFMDKIQEYRQQLLNKANPNKQLLLEDLLLQWALIYRT